MTRTPVGRKASDRRQALDSETHSETYFVAMGRLHRGQAIQAGRRFESCQPLHSWGCSSADRAAGITPDLTRPYIVAPDSGSAYHVAQSVEHWSFGTNCYGFKSRRGKQLQGGRLRIRGARPLLTPAAGLGAPRARKAGGTNSSLRHSWRSDIPARYVNPGQRPHNTEASHA